MGVLLRRQLYLKAVQWRRLLRRKRHNCAPGMLRVLWQPPAAPATLAAAIAAAAVAAIDLAACLRQWQPYLAPERVARRLQHCLHQ